MDASKFPSSALILAGGLGTRLRSVIGEIPKPMALIRGRPFLEFQMDWLLANGVQDLHLSVGYQAQMIRQHFGDSYREARLSWVVENEPLGTGGAIQFAISQSPLPESFWIINGDTHFPISLSRMADFHSKRKSHFSIALAWIMDRSRYGGVDVDSDSRIMEFLEKKPNPESGWINGGIYLVNQSILQHFPKGITKFSLETEVLQSKNRQLDLYGYAEPKTSFIDIGIPADFEKAQRIIL